VSIFLGQYFRLQKKLEIDNQKKGIDDRFEKYQGRRICGYMWEMI
jgi:hypothetical protein